MSGRGPWTSSKRFKRSSSGAASAGYKAKAKRWLGGSASVARAMTLRRPNPQAGTVAWSGSPFPRRLTTQITYAENIIFTTTAGVPYNYLFSTGSLYDPNVTSTGGQPRFMDTLCGANNTNAPYSAYRVFGSKITIEAVPGTAQGDVAAMRCFIGIGLFDTTATGPATLAELRARSDFRTKYMGRWDSGRDMCKLSRTMRQADLFDVSDVRDNQELAAAYNASPALDGRWCVTAVCTDSASTQQVQVLVKIVYDVEFFKRNDVPDS